MLILTDLKVGTGFEFDGMPYIVVYSQHTKIGRGGAIMRTRIKNLLNGAIVERTFKGSENFAELELERKKSQYLYKEGDQYYFMDSVNYSQFSLGKKEVGIASDFLSEGLAVDIIYYKGQPIDLKLPIKLDLKVTYTEPGFKGNTASATTKPATLETGSQIQVPLFINIGDKIRINTETGQYVERA